MAGRKHTNHPGINPSIIARGLLVPRTPAEQRALTKERRAQITHPISYVNLKVVRPIMRDGRGGIHPRKVHPEDFWNFHPHFLPTKTAPMLNPIAMDTVVQHLLRTNKNVKKEELEALLKLNNLNARVNYEAGQIAFWSYRLNEKGQVINNGWKLHHDRQKKRNWVLGIFNLNERLFATAQKAGKLVGQGKHEAEESLVESVGRYNAAKGELSKNIEPYEALRKKYKDIIEEAIRGVAEPLPP